MIKDKILVIDDEPSIINSIFRHLMIEDEDYELYSANNGEDGLKLYYKEEPVVVVLDINMPVMGGIEFLEKLKLASFDPCSVIVLTGHSDDLYIKKCFELGVSSFLRKPFNDYEIIGLIRHFISLKRVQQLLKEQIAYRELAQKALNDQRDKFIAVLMHDLKNPLIPVAYLARKLMEGKVKSEEDRKQKLRIIHESAENVLNIIENTSKALSKRPISHASEFKAVKLNEIITQVARNYLHVIEDKGIKISINQKNRETWDEIDNFTFEADFNQIKTAIENLLDNAVRYANSHIKIDLTKTDSFVRLTVTDDGPGIDKTYHEKIFEDYFQVPGSKKGYGLGMSSIKSVVENHKGKITVKSSLGNGTTFEVTLPCK